MDQIFFSIFIFWTSDASLNFRSRFEGHFFVLGNLVDQSRCGTNTSYLVDFIQITLSAKLLDDNQIRELYVKNGLSAAQIAVHFSVGKTVILARLHAMGINEGRDPKRLTNPENYRCHMAPLAPL